MDPIRVLIADDHVAFREGLRALLKYVPHVALVGEADGGLAAIRQTTSLQPDVILLDLQMPDLDGVEATRRILKSSPHIGILVLTMFEDDDSVFAAMRAGARGYLLKGATREEIARAILAVSRGEAIFSPAIAQRFMKYFASIASPPAFPTLSEREHEVLELVAQGLANAAIAAQLQLSIKTVRNHVSSIFHKLQVADRAQAIIRARDAGVGLSGAES